MNWRRYVSGVVICIVFLKIYPVWSQTQPFVIRISQETIAIGDKKRQDAPSRPPWWPDPEDTKFEKKFDLPFPVHQNAELHLEVLNVKLAKDYVEINGHKVGALYPDGGMSFVPSVIIIPPGFFNVGENTLTIESAKTIDGEEYDNFLMKNLELVFHKPGEAPVKTTDYKAEQIVTLPSVIDVIEGDEFSVNLVCSTNEGYKWQLQKYDQKLLHLVSELPLRVYDNEGRMEQQFDFLSILPGNTQIEFRKFYPSTGELSVLNGQTSQVRIAKQIILTGIIQESSIPQLGTHQLVDDMGNLLCILRTKHSEVNFNDYLGVKKVKVAGRADQSDEITGYNGLILMVRNISIISK